MIIKNVETFIYYLDYIVVKVVILALKTIKISEENYEWLVKFSGEMQSELGRSISIDKAIKMLQKNRLSTLAGSWKMDVSEVEKMKRGLNKGWKKWKISV